MGGAFGAVGGDLSAININPAGSLFFNNNFASASFTSFNTNNKANYFGTRNKESYSTLDLNQIGAVLVFNDNSGSTDWNKISVALNYENTNNFDNRLFTSGTNPFKYLVVTRIIATTLMLPILVFFGDTFALYGSYLVENLKGDVSFQLYFNKVFNALKFSDIIPATIKSFFFGFSIGLVGCFKGYNCKKGTVGVGEASNTAVVYASMLLFIVDFIAVFISDIFFEI